MKELCGDSLFIMFVVWINYMGVRFVLWMNGFDLFKFFIVVSVLICVIEIVLKFVGVIVFGCKFEKFWILGFWFVLVIL